MTREELEAVVFEALAAYRDGLTVDERVAAGGFFVGRVQSGTLVFGGVDELAFVVVVEEEGRP